MGLVRFALRFPYTFYVAAALIVFLGSIAAWTMRTDIFPEIKIPVVTVIWSYTGLSTPEMEQRVTTYSQYAISANVNGIKNIEAQTLAGLSVQKVYFQPDVNLDLAISQIVAATNSIRALMPPGIQPPVVVQFNASSVPVLQISLSSDTLNEQQLYDYGIYRVRQQLAPIAGVTLPTPSGGKYRQIMVDIDPAKLVAKGLTPIDVVNAVNAQNLTLPSGTAKIGEKQYVVRTNATPSSIDALNDIPIKVVNGATVFVKDVGQVHDGWLVQQNVVRQDGKRSILLSLIKNGNASTLEVVNAVKRTLADDPAGGACRASEINELFDQSVFVKQALFGVLREGAIAAALTAAMILLFLGSWRSTLVVMISIPLSILSSLVALYFLGETINTLTLGGLALAVGILVDDSTVTIENTHRLLTEERMPLPQATLHGAAGIAIPTLVSTLGHQLRVHVGGLPRRPGEVPVHAAGARRRVRDAGLLCPVADPDADHDRPADQGRKPCGADHGARPAVLERPPCLRTRLREHAPPLCRAAGIPDRRQVHRARHRRRHHRQRCGALHHGRPRLLPRDRRRAHPAPRACAGRHAHRGDGTPLPGRSRTRSARSSPSATAS